MPKSAHKVYSFFWLPWFKYQQILCVSSLSGTLLLNSPQCVYLVFVAIYILQSNDEDTSAADWWVMNKTFCDLNHVATPARAHA